MQKICRLIGEAMESIDAIVRSLVVGDLAGAKEIGALQCQLLLAEAHYAWDRFWDWYRYGKG